MLHRKLAVGGMLVGLAIGGLGLADRPEAAPSNAPTPPPVATITTDTGSIGAADDAVALWHERVEQHPLDYLSRTQLGRSLSRRAREHADLDDHRRAEEAHRSALALNPQHRPAQLGLAGARLAQHGFEEARALAEELVAADPTALDAVALAGDAAFELGDLATASAHYGQLAEAGVEWQAQLRLARLAAVQLTPSDAADIVTSTLAVTDLEALAPHTAASIWFQLGRHRFDAGDVDGALDALDEALRIDADHPGGVELRPFVLAGAGRTDEALTEYAHLVADDAAPDVEGLYADLLRTVGRSEEADEHERRARSGAVGLAERYPAERRHLVDFYVTRDPDLAVRLAEDDLAERRDAASHDALAWSLFHAGRADEAADAIEGALVGPALDASIRYHAAEIATAVGDTDAARHHLATALSTNPFFHPLDAASAAALADELGVSIG